MMKFVHLSFFPLLSLRISPGSLFSSHCFPAVFLIFFFSACHSSDTRPPATAPGLQTSQPLKIDDQGVDIVYSDSGKGDTTLIFIHGWCINKSYWTGQVAQFSGKYRVITIDLPGFGQSGRNRSIWTTQAYGRDIDTIMSRLNLKKVILIGHSMAGDIIVEATVHAPERVIGLVGVDNFKNIGYVGDEQSKKLYAAALDTMRHHFIQVATDYFKEDLFSATTDSSIRERVLNDVRHTDSTVAIACMEGNDYPEAAMVTAVKMTIHLINSDVNPTDTDAFKTRKIPYDLLYIHNTGHFPMIEEPSGFNKLLEQTIAKIARDHVAAR